VELAGEQNCLLRKCNSLVSQTFPVGNAVYRR